jgi:hypothetical protein
LSVVLLSAFGPVSVRDEVSVVDVLVVPLLGRAYCWVAVGDAVLGSVTPPNPVGSPYVAAELLPVSVWVTVTFDGVGLPVACGPASRIFSADGWFDSVVAAEAASGLSRLESMTLVAPGLPMEVPVVPPGGVPTVVAMMVLLDFILNAITRGRQAGSLASVPVVQA